MLRSRQAKSQMSLTMAGGSKILALKSIMDENLLHKKDDKKEKKKPKENKDVEEKRIKEDIIILQQVNSKVIEDYEKLYKNNKTDEIIKELKSLEKKKYLLNYEILDFFKLK